MTSAPAPGVTTLLGQIRDGDGAAVDALARRLYGELHALAAALMDGERPNHTLQPTALVHEALLRLLPRDHLRHATDKASLVSLAARAMRQVLVDHARRRATARRGGCRDRVPLDDLVDALRTPDGDLAALHEALDELARRHRRQADVVTLRFFVGLTVGETAERLGVAVSTVEADFRLARAWLRQQLKEDA